MAWQFTIVPRLLHFREPAGTSRGVYTVRQVWYVVLSDGEGRTGVGECAPLHDLSADAGPDYAERLEACCFQFCETGDLYASVPAGCPSMRFGLETALCHLRAGSLRFFDTAFSRGEEDVPINGLVWMGDHDRMLERMEAKLAQGFHCLKFKIGGIDFESECDLLRRVRERCPDPAELEIRLDANGSFTPENAMERLEILASFRPHSLEQPVRQGQWPLMAELCRRSPVPLALDEELIGVPEEAREDLLAVIRPAWLVLKPTLHGGMKGCEEWIDLAGQYGCGFWVTSALESNIGLNAIAQWRAKRPCDMPQGLGTGQLFTDNCEGMPSAMRGPVVHCDPARPEPDLTAWLGLSHN
ncbi:MAG: o-succinylbenzoate synthase [Desulfovibrionaceae bacterium]|nr:o-succinylbenzoate synthase [Desulfovibrionaceae bacterium]